MSVLSDISVQDGLAIRELASSICTARAREFIEVIRHFDAHRMDIAEYSVDPKDDVSNAIELANAHWIDDDGNYKWGTPKGTWKDFCDRVLANDKFWSGEVYRPTTSVEVDETSSRDLLLSTFVFPFHVVAKYADPIVQDGIIPLLNALNPSKVHFGSRSVFRLVAMAGSKDMGDLVHFSRSSEKACDFPEFSGFATAMSVSTGTNWKDVDSAIKRSTKIDHEVMDKGKCFLNLAGLANYLESQMAQGYRRGKTTKAALKWSNHREQELEDAELAKMDDLYHEEYPQSEYIHDEFNSSSAKGIGRVGQESKFRSMSSTRVAVIRLGREYHVLTKQDILSLKFAAMGHSMWHMYSATLALEYEPTDVVDDIDPRLSETDKNSILAARKVAKDASRMLTQLGMDSESVSKQEVVPYPKLMASLGDLWEWYMFVLNESIRIGRHDCLGRYLNEMFSIYTARLGGDLMAATVNESIRELVEEYGDLGFRPGADTAALLAILRTMPQSAIQDFGRLAKIVPAYDVNPIYSYMDRAAKMSKQNPRGKAEMTGDFTTRVKQVDASTHQKTMNKLKSASRIMLAVADVRARALDMMTDDDREAMTDEPYPIILAKLKSMQRSVATAIKFRHQPDIPVPIGLRSAAKSQAKLLVDTGRMPDNEWAGGYLDVSSTLAYTQRGDPDLAILKATAVVSGRLRVAMSNISGAPRATPTRLNDGQREKGSGTMVTDYLLDKFPSRSQSLAFVAEHVPIASTSDKIETVKWPFKTRVITSMCAEGRRIQGEYEHNNGKVLVHVPGFMMGISPADRLKRTYATLRQDTKPGVSRIYGSLDLSSFSQGMHWDIQEETNDVLYDAYGLDKVAQKKLEMCTLGAYMIRVESNLRLFMVNSTGSNFEGLDGKRNTFMHCTLWYLARCEAYRAGVEAPMRAFLYIDDGAFSLEEEDEKISDTVRTLREALITVYTSYGFKLNLSKTVISTSYMQFLNELFLHGIHIGYGFRALCHTAAQSFPTAATVSEELAVITGGIRGSGVAGGHSLRLLVGYTYILWLYTIGVVGSKGYALRCESGYILALVLWLPTIAGGFGLPSWTRLFSNLSGNRDAEKLDAVACIAWVIRRYFPERFRRFAAFVKTEMAGARKHTAAFMPDRVTIAHPGTARFGDMGRNVKIAENALELCKNPKAEVLIREFLRTGGRPEKGGVAEILVNTVVRAPVRLPMAYVEKALSTEPKAAIVTLITKVASSFLVSRVLTPMEIKSYNRMYVASAQTVVKEAYASLHLV
jgi:hypothetical protein